MKPNRIDIIGSKGFIGKAIVNYPSKLIISEWSHLEKNSNNYFDLFDQNSWSRLLDSSPKTVIFLSWPGLPNYDDKKHLTKNVPAIISLVEKLASAGIKRIVFAGTCYEYGKISGSLKEEMSTNPINNYAIAKDTLRKYISNFLKNNSVEWGWLRIFYTYGENQNPNSLYPSLIASIKDDKKFFNLSSGKQIRDFIPVEEVAKHFLILATHPNIQGIYNSGCGSPSSILEFVEKIKNKYSSSINIKRYFYKDRDDEPLAFWANTEKLENLINSYPFLLK